MNVNVSSLRSEIVKLKSLLKDYEDNYLNLYNEINTTSSYWKDEESFKFFDLVPKEKLEVKNVLDQAYSVLDIYSFVVSKYQEIGNRIQVDLSKRDIVYSNFNNYIDQLGDIIKCYKNLDISFCRGSKEGILILNELNILEGLKKDVIETFDKVKDIYKKIYEIESEVNNRISKIGNYKS